MKLFNPHNKVVAGPAPDGNKKVMVTRNGRITQCGVPVQLVHINLSRTAGQHKPKNAPLRVLFTIDYI